MFYQWLTDDVISAPQLANCLSNCHQKDPMSEREERKPSKNMFKSTAGTKLCVMSGLCRKSKILREVLRRPFFQQVTPLMNSEKWGKFVTTPAVDTIAKIPLRGKGLLCFIIISNVLVANCIKLILRLSQRRAGSLISCLFLRSPRSLVKIPLL